MDTDTKTDTDTVMAMDRDMDMDMNRGMDPNTDEWKRIFEENRSKLKQIFLF
jgi:hypothetical protein